MDNLVGLGYVSEERIEYSNLLRYTYSLTQSGESFAKKQLESMKVENPELLTILSSAIGEIKDKETQDLVDWSKEVTGQMYE